MAKPKRGPARKRKPGHKPAIIRQAPHMPLAMPLALIGELIEVDEMIEAEEFAEARGLLDELNDLYPNRREVLERLALAAGRMGDAAAVLKVTVQLSRLAPNDPFAHAALASGYLGADKPVLALKTFTDVLQRWPDHELVLDIQSSIEELKPAVADLLSSAGLEGDEGFADGIQYEEAGVLFLLGKSKEAIATARDLISRRPRFVGAYHVISDVHFIDGDFAAAIAVTREVLDFDPENLDALFADFRCHFLSGTWAEADRALAQLRAVVAKTEHGDLSLARALSYGGDDIGVLETFDRLRLRGGEVAPELYHLAAVAAMRLDPRREEESFGYWQRALELDPSLSVAEDNLDDLDEIVEERHAPWAFPLVGWVSVRALEAMIKLMHMAKEEVPERKLAGAVTAFLRNHPEIVALIPALLDRGDQVARSFLAGVAVTINTPEIRALMRDFVLSRRGPDAQRLAVADKLAADGLLPAGPARLWIEGDWRDVLLIGAEIHDDVPESLTPKILRLLQDAFDLIVAGKPDRAEKILKPALAANPDSPALLNQLAMTYSRQGRREEADSLIDRVLEVDPDYLYARTNKAMRYAADGEIAKAKALLEPILMRKRLHHSEVDAVCKAWVAVYVGDKDFASAEQWLDLWERHAPEHPHIPGVRAQLEDAMEEMEEDEDERYI